MRKQHLFSLIAGAAVLATVAMPDGPARAQDVRSYIMGTATTGGTYYPVGVAISTLSKVKLEPKEKIAISAISTAGSGENVKLMREGQAQFAILQGLFGAWAWHGEGQLQNEGKQEWLRSIASLWQNVEQFVVRSDYAKTGTIEDLKNLKGMKFSIGQRNSGTEGSGRTILSNLGYDVDNAFDLVFQGYNPTADGMQNGVIMGANMTGGPPVPGVVQIFAAMGDQVRILNFTDAQIQQANGRYKDLWTRFTIPADTYPNEAQPIETMGQTNYLSVHMDVPENDVYLLTKTMFENLPFLNNIHPSTKEMDLKTAAVGLPAPLHPGAYRYYQEKGIEVPDHLVPK